MEVAVIEVCMLAIGKRLLKIEMRRGLMKVINPFFKTKFGFYVSYLRYSVAMYFLKETVHCAFAWWFCWASHLLQQISLCWCWNVVNLYWDIIKSPSWRWQLDVAGFLGGNILRIILIRKSKGLFIGSYSLIQNAYLLGTRCPC